MKQSITSGERQLLNILLHEPSPIGISELRDLLGKSKRMIYYYINNVNDLFDSYFIGKIQLVENGYFITNDQKQIVPEILRKNPIIFTPKERQLYLTCFLIFYEERITLECIEEEFQVSKNTILSDLLEVRHILSEYQLTLKNTKAIGYYVDGDIFRKRALFQVSLRRLLKTVDYHNLELLNINKIEMNIQRLKQVFINLEIESYPVDIIALSFLLSSIKTTPTPYNYKLLDIEFVAKSKEIIEIDRIFPELPHHEKVYLAIQLIRFRNSESRMIFDDDLYLLDLSNELVDTFELLSCMKFTNRDRLINSIYLHIQLSNYQYHYSIPSVNPLIDDVKEKYSEIYNITKICCKKLKEVFPYPVLESEISFLSIHFAAFLNMEDRVKESAQVLLVCLNSTASSLLLKNEIENVFEFVDIVEIVKPDEAKTYCKNDIDFVISTIDFKCEHPIIVVNPILTDKDIRSIENMLIMTSKGEVKTNQNNTIQSIIRDNIKDDRLYNKIMRDIETNFQVSGLLAGQKTSHVEHNSLLDMVNIFGVQFDMKYQTDWETAIREVSKGLLQLKYIENRYIEKMINLINEYGPYIVINEYIAIAHAQPNDGALKLGLTMRIFKNKLKIKDKRVNILFILSTTNQTEHLSLINDILSLSKDSDSIIELKNSSNQEEVIKILTNHRNKYS